MNDGKKKKPQKHQNKRAFKIVFDPQAIDHQKKVSLAHLCKRCVDQINWKLSFNKYKKMTEPTRCNFCQQKNVLRTYMKACDKCAEEKNSCAKCLEVEYEKSEIVKLTTKQRKHKQQEQNKNTIQFMKTLKQRSRRTIRRGVQKRTIKWDNQLLKFVDEEGNEIVGLHFRNAFAGEGEDDQFDDQFADDDIQFGQGQSKPKKQKKSQEVNQDQDCMEEDEDEDFMEEEDDDDLDF